MITKMRPWRFGTNGDERYLVSGLEHGYQLQAHESLHESSSSQQLLDISSFSGDERALAGAQLGLSANGEAAGRGGADDPFLTSKAALLMAALK